MLFLLIGLIVIMIALFRRNQLMEWMKPNYIFIEKMRSKSWLQNHWICGLLLFMVNTFLFFLVGFILFFLVIYVTIPYLHLVIMFAAVIISFYCWNVFNQIWSGTKRNRIKMGTFGSSFYIIMTGIFYYRYVTLEPAYPGDDVFMAAIGLWFGMIVTVVAFVSCFVMTAFSQRRNKNWKLNY